MTRITLMVELDRPQGKFAPGECVAGKVTTRSDNPWVAKDFRVALYWKTTGTGRENMGTALVQAMVPKGGRVTARAEYPFRVEVPPMPWTYHGVHLHIDWYLRVEAVGTGARERTRFDVPIEIHPRNGDQQKAPRTATPTADPAPQRPEWRAPPPVRPVVQRDPPPPTTPYIPVPDAPPE